MPRPNGVVLVCAVSCALASVATYADRRDPIVSSRFSNSVLRYDGATGDSLGTFAEGSGLINAIGMDVGPDGQLYVASGDDPVVFRFDLRTGAFIDRFIFDDPVTPEDETGGLSRPRGMLFGPDHNLYLSSGGSDQVLRYDGATGEFLDVFASDPLLDGPIGLLFESDGDLLVASALTDRVFEFDGETGTFKSVAAMGSIIDNPTGLTHSADGALLVASGVRHHVVAYDGQTHDFIGVFASGNGLETPIGVTLGPDDLLYVGSFGTDSVLRFDGVSGTFIDQFISPGSGGLDGTHFILFLPPVANIASVDVPTGSLLGGDLRDLHGSDDSAIHTRSGFGFTLVDLHHMEMRVSATTTVQTPASLDLTIESRIDQPAGTAQVRLLNHNTQQFDLVGQHALGSADAINTITDIDATNYVNAQGDIELSIKHIVFVPFLAFTFESWIDWVEIAVE